MIHYRVLFSKKTRGSRDKMYAMEDVIGQIKKRIDIISYIGSFISVKKSGRNYKALCPFHQEKTPSFVISPDRQIWHCFGACQEGGDIIRFLMKWENITFIEALRELAKKADVQLVNVHLEDKTWKKKERLLQINFLAAEFFEYILQKTQIGEKARDYLADRKLDPRIVKKFQLGYAPASWDSLLNFLKKKKFTEFEIVESGLMVKSERGRMYDRFRGRLMFPIKDPRENVIGFSGRILDKNAKEAKYINTPETLVYHKRETLYGINIAKEAIKDEKNVLIVEGEFDVISPFQQGIENVVAIKGSAVTREQLMLLKRYTDKITLALDSDAAGIEAIKKGIEEAEDMEFDIGVVTFTFGKDPDEAVQKDLVSFKKLIKNPIPLYDFIIESSQKKNPSSDPYNKKHIADEVVGFMAKIKNPIVLSHYVKKLSTILDVSEESIQTLIRKMQTKKSKFVMIPKKKIIIDLSREDAIQKYILSVIFQDADPYKRADQVFKIFEVDDFSIPAYQKIYQQFIDYKKSHPSLKLEEFVKTLPSELQPVFDEVYLFASSEIDVKSENMGKLVYEAKKFSLKRKISQLISAKDSDNEEVKSSLKRINQELNRVEKMIMTL